MKNFTGTLSFITAMPFVLGGCQQKKEMPNILYIMSDDHTSQAIGAYGSRFAKIDPTPNIDRLAKEGIMFENCFVTNSISTPSRACIMTGQYSQTNGVLDLNGKLAPERQYLAHEMKKLGYTTAIIGKWHLVENPEAFDYYNILHGQGDYFDPILLEKGMTSKVTRNGREFIGKMYNGHSSDVLADMTLEWLQNKRDKSKPFFLMHHFKAPHDIFEFAPRYKDYLEDVTMPEPESLWDNKNNGSLATRGIDNSLMDTIGSSIGNRNIIRNMGMHMEIDPSLPEDEYKLQAYQEYMKRYFRCVKGVDDNLKRILDYLEKEGLMENTIIIYTGDQGMMLGEHDYIDKRWMYEESMRMPFIVRYPKMIKPGSRTNAIINNTDFAPTLIDLAGGVIPEYMQGESFKEILETGKEPEGWRTATYYRYWMHMAHQHSNPAHFGIRTKEYKLIFFYGVDYMKRTRNPADPNPVSLSDFQTPVAWEFYDLRNDPFEMDNRYNDPSYKDIISGLKQELTRLREELNETDNGYPHIQKIIGQYWNN